MGVSMERGIGAWGGGGIERSMWFGKWTACQVHGGLTRDRPIPSIGVGVY